MPKLRPITFDTYGNASRRLPRQCVTDCSHTDACDDDVAYWVDRLAFETSLEPHADQARAYLREFGAWDDLATCDVRTLAERILWSAACDEREGNAWLGLIH